MAVAEPWKELSAALAIQDEGDLRHLLAGEVRQPVVADGELGMDQTFAAVAACPVGVHKDRAAEGPAARCLQLEDRTGRRATPRDKSWALAAGDVLAAALEGVVDD